MCSCMKSFKVEKQMVEKKNIIFWASSIHILGSHLCKAVETRICKESILFSTENQVQPVNTGIIDNSVHCLSFFLYQLKSNCTKSKFYCTVGNLSYFSFSTNRKPCHEHQLKGRDWSFWDLICKSSRSRLYNKHQHQNCLSRVVN